MKAKDLKIRCSALGNVMHIDRATKLTDKQKVDLETLLAKGDSITPNQKETLDKLIVKRDAKPDISKGAKTYVKDVFFGKTFDFQKRFTNKYVQKGNQLEDTAIKELVDHLGIPMAFKNEKYFENDFIHGTPDTLFQRLNFQFDVKNVYYPNGLDTFDTKLDHIYEWQQHGYNWLIGVDNGFVIKVLKNPPPNILEKEAKILWVESGREWNDPIPDEFHKDVAEYFNFERMPIEDRIKIYKIETTQNHIDQIKEAIKLSRNHYSELLKIWETKNVDEVEFIKGLKIAV